MTKCQGRELDIMLEDYHVEIRYRVKGLVNVLEIEIHAISLCIMSKGLNITSEDLMS